MTFARPERTSLTFTFCGPCVRVPALLSADNPMHHVMRQRAEDAGDTSAALFREMHDALFALEQKTHALRAAVLALSAQSRISTARVERE